MRFCSAILFIPQSLYLSFAPAFQWRTLNVVLVMVWQDLLGRLASLRGALKVEPTSLEALKGVLSTTAATREASLPMELHYIDLEERFRWPPTVISQEGG